MTASAALYAGILFALVGAVGVVHPLRALHIRKRSRGSLLALSGLALAAAAALSPSRMVRSASAGHRGSSALDEWMPDYHFNEFHSRHVEAPPERVYAALKQVRPGEIRFFLLLTGIRALDVRRLFGRGVPPLPSQPPILDISRGGGFLLLEEEPGREVLLGVCGQFWRMRGSGRCPDVRTPAELLAFSRPGYAKATINFRVVPEGSGARLTTETRILATDQGARRRFAAYWRLIHPGSALMRRAWLEAIRRRAESPTRLSGRKSES